MSSRSRGREYPSQSQLVIPLLDTIAEAGGAARSRDVAAALAEQLEISRDVQERTVRVSGRPVNAWQRDVRWAAQKARFAGLLNTRGRGIWALTDNGREGLHTAERGVVVTVYETERGVAVHATCEAAMRYIADGSVNLLLTSPPYPLVFQKEYGNLDADAYVEWILELAREWKRLLAEDGSLILNLGPTYEKGQPTLSTYQYELYVRLRKELGFFLAGEHFWHSPSRMPAPAEWVTVRRVRITQAVEHAHWFSKTPHPKADNRRVLREYSNSMKRRIRSGGEKARVRPSGHRMNEGAFAADHGGSIPHNLLQVSHTTSNDAYLRYCREHGLKVHPARFPDEFASFLIRLTTDIGDVVYDPFGGSLTVAEVCEQLDRRWLASDSSLTYLAGGAGGRLSSAPGFVDHAGLPSVA